MKLKFMVDDCITDCLSFVNLHRSDMLIFKSNNQNFPFLQANLTHFGLNPFLGKMIFNAEEGLLLFELKQSKPQKCKRTS